MKQNNVVIALKEVADLALEVSLNDYYSGKLSRTPFDQLINSLKFLKKDFIEYDAKQHKPKRKKKVK